MKSPAQCLLWGLVSASIATAYHERQQKPLGDVQIDSAVPSTAPTYRQFLLDLQKSLVTIPSISGDERNAAAFLADYLSSLGYDAWLQWLPTSLDGAPRRANVVARPTTDREAPRPRVLVTSHIDVVPPYIPYHIDAATPSDITSDTFISGRGSVDAKASVAAQITAVQDLLGDKQISPDDVILLFVVGEETTGDGMRTFSAALEEAAHPAPSTNRSSSSSSSSNTISYFDAAIFGEPTENKLACGHKGITFGAIRAQGKAGHSGYPWLGKSATEILVRALSKILSTDFGSSERYGNTTVNIGKIDGGVAANVIPKEAEARLSVRIAVGNRTTGADIIRGKLNEILKEIDGEALSMESIGGYGPIECSCDVDGFDTMVANYGTDVPHLIGNHVSYLYGPGSILVAHGDDEGLRVRDLEESVEGYKKLIKHVLEA